MSGKDFLPIMSQFVVHEFPPLYDRIASKFGLLGRRDVIFSWADLIYNPHSVYIPDELLAHEAVHGERQGSGQQIIDWWKRYIDDRAFRLDEEIPAHKAEYEYLMKHGNRRERRKALKTTASRLTSPLYGRLITQADAMAVLKTH